MFLRPRAGALRLGWGASLGLLASQVAPDCGRLHTTSCNKKETSGSPLQEWLDEHKVRAATPLCLLCECSSGTQVLQRTASHLAVWITG